MGMLDEVVKAASCLWIRTRLLPYEWEGKGRSPCVMCAEFFAAGHSFLWWRVSSWFHPSIEQSEALTVGTTPRILTPVRVSPDFPSQDCKLEST